ncbi:MFS transporter [Ectobacillus sp. sgz5001026]|uniref:MFS transporter n=1 Tax=Ectobacillus sp. sgz5001026 TaxID=3242473 RepID=UPI0036D3B85B
MTKPKLWTPNFIRVSISNFFLFLVFYCLLVTLPIYAMQTFHSHASSAGLLVTVFLFAAIIIRPLTGRWIEQLGRRTVLTVSFLIFFVVALLYFVPQGITGLLVLRFLHGIGFGMATTVAGTIVADVIPSSRIGEGMGYFTMSTNLAMVLGPFIGLTIYQNFGISNLFIISSSFAFLSLLIGLLIKIPKYLPENNPSVPHIEFSFSNLFEVSAIRISLVASIFALVYSSILSFVSVYAKGIGFASSASYFFVVYAVVLILSRPFTGKWFDLYGANKVMYPSILLFAIGMVVLSTANSALLFLLSAALIGLGWGTLFPFLQTIAIRNAAPSRKGVATATFLSIFDTGIGIGSVVVGLAAGIGFRSLYFYSTFVILLAMLGYFIVTKKKVELQPKKEATNL